MDLESFRECLDARGANLAAWPADDRGLAEDLLRKSAGARAALDAALALEARLTHAMAGDRAGEALRARIATLPAGHLRSAAGQRRPAGWWAALAASPWRIGSAAATVALLLGLYVGAAGSPPFGVPQSAQRADAVVDVANLAFGSGLDEEILP